MNDQTNSTDIALIVERTPAVILQDSKQKAALFASIEQEIADFVPDLTTDKGRKAVASLAFKVTKTKTAIDAARKGLIEDARKTVDGVNTEWKLVRDRLEELTDKARAPLSAWEEAEAERANNFKIAMQGLEAADKGLDEENSEYVSNLHEAIKALTYTAEIHGEDFATIIEFQSTVLDRLDRIFASKVKAEADAAELAELRRQREERDAQEAANREEERLAAEAKAEQQAAAERERIAEENRKAAEKAAEERATLAAQEEARKEREAREAAHAAELAAEKEKSDRLAKEKTDREAEEKRKSDEEAKRQADRNHRSKIMSAAKTDIMEFGISEELAISIVRAIVAGDIANVSIKF